MISEQKNIQIIVALLKKYNISKVVISPGSSHMGLVGTLQEDAFFECYSIVDERSAAFFALGLIQQTNNPVAICCTKGTAACNYLSAMTEAYYKKLPLLAITADWSRDKLNQQQEQCIPQREMYLHVAKKVVNIDKINSQADYNFSVRLVNEALFELTNKNKGPVHINYFSDEAGKMVDKQLPDVLQIEYILEAGSWEDVRIKLENKRILIIYGQSMPATESLKMDMAKFCDKYNCVIATDKESNLNIDKCLELYLPAMAVSRAYLKNELHPDIIITMNGNYFTYPIKFRFKDLEQDFESWNIDEEQNISTPFGKLNVQLSCSVEEFFSKCVQHEDDVSYGDSYYQNWLDVCNKITTNMVEHQYSQLYAIKLLLQKIPENSMVHLGNGHIARVTQLFPTKKSVQFYRNSATTGIDGSVSTFVGAASVADKLSFLIIGDLSFFYDTTGLWNSYITKNMRIFVSNNAGGETMRYATRNAKVSEECATKYICTENQNSVEAWVKDRGFDYISARNKEEFRDGLERFLNVDRELPVVFEVFSDAETNQAVWDDVMEYNASKFQDMRCSCVRVGESYYIYGTSKASEKVEKLIEHNGGIVLGYCDSNANKWGTLHKGKPVISFNDICCMKNSLFAIGSTFDQEIRQTLLTLGVEEQRIVSPLRG